MKYVVVITMDQAGTDSRNKTPAGVQLRQHEAAEKSCYRDWEVWIKRRHLGPMKHARGTRVITAISSTLDRL